MQSWRTRQFTDEHEDSIITVTLEEGEDGTLLTLVHSNVPEGQRSYEQGGWQEHYFEPMKQYFARRKRTGISAASNGKRKRTSAETKSKQAVPKARATAGKKRSKHARPARAKSKRAKKAKSRSKGGKRRR